MLGGALYTWPAKRAISKWQKCWCRKVRRYAGSGHSVLYSQELADFTYNHHITKLPRCDSLSLTSRLTSKMWFYHTLDVRLEMRLKLSHLGNSWEHGHMKHR